MIELLVYQNIKIWYNTQTHPVHNSVMNYLLPSFNICHVLPFTLGFIFPTLKSHTMINSFKGSLKRKTDGLSRFFVYYPPMVVFLFVFHYQYEVSLTNQLPFVVGCFKLFVLFCVGCLGRVFFQGSSTVDGFLLLMI